MSERDVAPGEQVREVRATAAAPDITTPTGPPAPVAGPGAVDPGRDDAAVGSGEVADGAAAAEPVAEPVPGAAGGAASGREPRLDDETPPLRKILEAILLVVDQPVPAVELAQVVEQPRAIIEAALSELVDDYRRAGRGFELRQVAGGWRLFTAADCAPYVERFVLEGQQARLTQAALETLAVVAYRQPVSRQSIAAIRGVNVDGVVRTLLGRGLIAEAGQDGPGGAHLYVTTPYFLERLGLRSLDELPNLAPLLPGNLDGLTDQV